MRGRHRKAAADSSISPAQRPPSISHLPSAEASMRASVAESPPPSPQTTNTPTASSAASFTTASTAMAMTTPLWRSFASRLRVPKITVNSASPAATHSAVWPFSSPGARSSALNTSKLSVTDCSCSAI